MSKSSGLGDNFYINGYDLSGDINSLNSISTSLATLDVTGINKSANERIAGVRDGALNFTAYFNAATSPSGAHPVLSRMLTTDQIITYARGTNLGDPAACMVAKQLSYDPTRGDDGDLKVAVNTVANGYGLEWGNQLTAGIRNDTAATTGSSFDLGVGATSFGLQAYLQVFLVTGTSCTVKIQHSSDNSAWADLTGGGFTAATGVTTERIATTSGLTVNRYLRVLTSGTFSACNFSVVAVRNDAATSF